jgi:hypothetical protein
VHSLFLFASNEFTSLTHIPYSVREELIEQHEVDAQISESGLDPEALAA